MEGNPKSEVTPPTHFITDVLRRKVSDRLFHLNQEVGRGVDWYSDEAEAARAKWASEQLDLRAAAVGTDVPAWMRDRVPGTPRAVDVERLTAWEFRETRDHYNRIVSEWTELAAKFGVEVRPVLLVEGPTGRLTAEITLDPESGVAVAYIEEGLLDFALQVTKVFFSSLPIPDDSTEELQVKIEADVAQEIIHCSGGQGQLLRVFEIVCHYLVGPGTKPFAPYPVHPLQSLMMAPVWECMASFVYGHEFAHAMHGDLHRQTIVRSRLDLAVLVEALIRYPRHLARIKEIFPELHADFRASDLVVATHLKDGGEVAALLAPLLFLEFIDDLEFCLFRLAYGRDARRPEFIGNPAPQVRQAYLMGQMRQRVQADLYAIVESTFLESQKICNILFQPVFEQMHILWQNGVQPNPRWRATVKRMKPLTDAKE